MNSGDFVLPDRAEAIRLTPVDDRVGVRKGHLMRYRRITLGIAAALIVVPMSAGCGGATSRPAATATVTVTAPAPSPSTGPANVELSASTPAVTTRHTLPPGHGVGASAFVGTWERHESELVIANPPGSSSLVMGASAFDVEKWSITWTPDGRDLDITLGRLLSKSGNGVGGLHAGKVFTAQLSADSALTTISLTSGLGDTGGTLTWCRPGGGSPGCGA